MKDFFCLLFYQKIENTKIWPEKIELGNLNPSDNPTMNEKNSLEGTILATI